MLKGPRTKPNCTSRLADEFDEKPDQTVTDQIDGQEKTVKGASPADHPEQGKQDDAFAKGFVKLRGMTERVRRIEGGNTCPRGRP